MKAICAVVFSLLVLVAVTFRQRGGRAWAMRVGGWAVLFAVAMAVVAPVSGSAPRARGITDSPTVTGALDSGIPSTADMCGGAIRIFGPSGHPTTGLLYLGFMVAEFVGPSTATAELPTLVDQAATLLGRQGTALPMRRASTGELGDEAVAFVGTLTTTSTKGPVEFAVALVGVRAERFVHLMVGVARGEDPLMSLIRIGERIVGRVPGPAATPTGGEGLRTGGLWDMLPGLDDLPPGLVLMDEQTVGSASSATPLPLPTPETIG